MGRVAASRLLLAASRLLGLQSCAEKVEQDAEHRERRHGEKYTRQSPQGAAGYDGKEHHH